MAKFKPDNLLDNWLKSDLPQWHLYQPERYEWYHHNWEQLFPFSSKRYYNIVKPIHSLHLDYLENKPEFESLFLLDSAITSLFFLMKNRPEEEDLILLPHHCSRTIPKAWKGHIQFYQMQSLNTDKGSTLILFLEALSGLLNVAEIKAKINARLRGYKKVILVLNLKEDRLLFNPDQGKTHQLYLEMCREFEGKVDFLSEDELQKIKSFRDVDYEVLNHDFYGYSYFDEYLLSRGARLLESKKDKRTTEIRLSPFHSAYVWEEKVSVLSEQDEKYLWQEIKGKKFLDYPLFLKLRSVVG